MASSAVPVAVPSGQCLQNAVSRLTDMIRTTARTLPAPMSSFYQAAILTDYVQSRLSSAEYARYAGPPAQTYVVTQAMAQVYPSLTTGQVIKVTDLINLGTESALMFGAGICGNHAQAFRDLCLLTSHALNDPSRFIQSVRAIQFWVSENKLIPTTLAGGQPNPKYLDSYNHITAEFQYPNDAKWRLTDVTWGRLYYKNLADRDSGFPILGWDDIAALKTGAGYSSAALLASARTNLLDTWLFSYQQALGRDASEDDYLGSYISVDVERDGTGTITHKPKGTGVRTNPVGQQVQGFVYQQDTNGAWNKPAYFGWAPAALTGNLGVLKLRILNTLQPTRPLTQLLISAPRPQSNVSTRPDPQRVFIDSKRGGATQTLGPWLLNNINNQPLLLDFSLNNLVADELLVYFDPGATGARIDFTAGWLHLGY